MLYYAGQYDQAIDVLTTIIGGSTTPGSMERVILGQCYLQKGMYREAIGEFQRAQEPSGDYAAGADLTAVARSLEGITYARMGETEKAGRILADLAPSGGERASEPCWVGLLEIALGRSSEGFTFLEQACDGGDMWLRYILVQPLFDDIRSDERYEALLERMNLRDAQ